MKLVYALVLLLITQLVSGQTVPIPDVNLQNKLIAMYPQVMQGNQLIVAQAAALTGTLDIRNAGVVNGSGVEYFTGINKLDATNNQLAVFPDISATTGLTSLYLNYNKLTSLPDMSALTQLHDFQVMGNQLTALPALYGPAVAFLYCSGNKITQFPSLTPFPNLLYLVIGDNPYQNVIDFSPCTNLQQLHVHRTGTDTIIGLDKLTKLSVLYAWGNQIRSFKALDSITTLTMAFLYDNPITEVPYTANKPALSTLAVANDYLTFEDLVPVAQMGAPAAYTYTPQRSIAFTNATARLENPYTLRYPVAAPLSTNRYVWRKNGIVLDSSASPSYTFNPITYSDSGKYVLTVYNTTMTNLVLHSDTLRLFVRPCLELSIPALTILSKDCVKGYALDFSQNLVSGGTAPLVYELTNGLTRKKFTGNIADNVAAGPYVLSITDSKNCSAGARFTLDKISSCDPVITPNGDGIADIYFIEKAGKVYVYDLKRKLVNTLQGPVVWDGTDQNGAVLDAGMYILIMEEESPVNITIIR